MKEMIFKNWQPEEEKKEYIRVLFEKLNKSGRVDWPTDGYISALSLAALVCASDTDNIVQMIDIHLTFVRVYKLPEGLLPMGAIIRDLTRGNPSYLNGFPRPLSSTGVDFTRQ